MREEEVRLILLSLVCVPLCNVIFTDEEQVLSEHLGDILLSLSATMANSRLPNLKINLVRGKVSGGGGRGWWVREEL